MPVATIILPKSPTLLGHFYKAVKIIHFSSQIIFGQLLLTFGVFYWSHWSELVKMKKFRLKSRLRKDWIYSKIQIRT